MPLHHVPDDPVQGSSLFVVVSKCAWVGSVPSVTFATEGLANRQGLTVVDDVRQMSTVVIIPPSLASMLLRIIGEVGVPR